MIIMPSKGSKNVNMTQMNIQRNGSMNNNTVNGTRIIVALSSIQVSLGHSEATTIAAINGAMNRGVSKI